MKGIVYVGSSDARVFSELDLDRLGVSHKEVVFARGVTENVSNQLAEILLTDPLVERDFRVVSEGEEVESEDENLPDSDDNGDSSTDNQSSDDATEKKPRGKPKASG